MLKFNDFLLEKSKSKYNSDFVVGDKVYINYYLTGDMTPVEIIEKKGHNYFIVSFNVEGSHVFNAPTQGIKKDEIVGRYQGINQPINNMSRRMENPTLDPDVSGSIPNWKSTNNDHNNNGIAF